MLSGAPANSRIDPAALLLQQQLAGGNVPSSMPAGGYTGGQLPTTPSTLPGATAAPAANDPTPLALQKRAPEFQLFKESSHDNAMLTGLNDLREENFLCDVTLMADDKPFQVDNTAAIVYCPTELLYFRHIEQFLQPPRPI